MADSPETKKQPKPREIRFMPEGYVDPDGPEFLDQFLRKLQESGIDTTDLLYTGMDGKHLYAPDGSLNRTDAIFAMNETGWRKAIEHSESTPGGFVKKDAEVPIIALFDGSYLSEPQKYRLQQDTDDYWDTIEILDIVPKPDAAPIKPQDGVEEVVIHKDYPNASPMDAMAGVVYVQEETYKQPRDHGF
jgi:hypothetical protein